MSQRQPRNTCVFFIGQGDPAPRGWNINGAPSAASTAGFDGNYVSFVRVQDQQHLPSNTYLKTPFDFVCKALGTEATHITNAAHADTVPIANMMQEIYANSIGYPLAMKSAGKSSDQYINYARTLSFGPDSNTTFPAIVLNPKQYNALPDLSDLFAKK